MTTETTTLPRLGLHDDIDESLYHGDPNSLSSSSAKRILYDGPAEYQRSLLQSEHNDAFDFGSVVHALVLGVGEYEVLDFPNWLTAASRTMRDIVRARGVAPIIPRDMAKAEAMRDAVLEHPVAGPLLADGKPEVSIWATDPATGVLMRGRIDWLRIPVFVDVKTSSGRVDPESFAATVMRYHYGFQAAYYKKLLALNGVQADPLWIPATKRPPYETEVLRPADDLIEFSMGEVDRALELYAHCQEADEWPELAELPPQPAALDYITHSRTVEAVTEVIPFGQVV